MRRRAGAREEGSRLMLAMFDAVTALEPSHKRDLLARFPLNLTSDLLDVEFARAHWHLSTLPGKYNACGSLEGLASENAPRKRTKPIDRANCNVWLILHAAHMYAGQPCETVGRSNGRTS